MTDGSSSNSRSAGASLGDTNAKIAEALQIVPETVKKHLAHVYAKRGVGRRTEAAGRALSLGLVASERPRPDGTSPD